MAASRGKFDTIRPAQFACLNVKTMKRSLALLGIVVSLVLYFLWSNEAPPAAPHVLSAEMADSPPSASKIGQSPLLPLPPVPALSPEKIALGKQLFHEPKLSHDNSLSCASCHDLQHGGVDHQRVSAGIHGQLGSVNAPTVFNVSLNVAQFWDGRASTLEEQIAGPLLNPVEMGSTWPEVLAKLSADPTYRQAFQQNYADGISMANVVDALVTFERSLITHGARFDRYLTGDKHALNAAELEGYHRFVDHGCASCHQGAGIGGNMFQHFGIMADYFKDRPLTRADMGRFNVTGLEEDRHVFKVPSLRNVALTAPYFHDGSADTLEKAVRIMGQYQLGMELSDADTRYITAFLRTLSGEWEGKMLQ